MDVANYLRELLMQNGEVNVPGLGCFVQVKVNGYYDNTQGKFYPPTHKIQFDEEYVDDNVLLQYIAEKKKISLASSKYFTAKYIDNLRQQAMATEVPLGDFGTLYFEEGKLHFKMANTTPPIDPAFYGFPPVAINKLQSTSVYEQIDKAQEEMSRPIYVTEPSDPQPLVPIESSPLVELPSEIVPTKPQPEHVIPVEATPVIEPLYVAVPPVPQPEPDVPIGAPPVAELPAAPSAIFTPQPAYNSPSTADHEEEFIFHGRGYSPKKEDGYNSNWIWITITVIVVLGIMSVFALYKFKPNTFNKLFGGGHPTPVVLKTPQKQDTVKAIIPVVKPDSADTAKKVPVDNIAKAASVNTPTAIDTFARVRYEILGGSFLKIDGANGAITRYKKLGFDAKIVKNAPGRLYKVTLGTYFTVDDAVNAMHAIVKTGLIGATRMSIQPYNPKK